MIFVVNTCAVTRERHTQYRCGVRVGGVAAERVLQALLGRGPDQPGGIEVRKRAVPKIQVAVGFSSGPTGPGINPAPFTAWAVLGHNPVGVVQDGPVEQSFGSGESVGRDGAGWDRIHDGAARVAESLVRRIGVVDQDVGGAGIASWHHDFE